MPGGHVLVIAIVMSHNKPCKGGGGVNTLLINKKSIKIYHVKTVKMRKTHCHDYGNRKNCYIFFSKRHDSTKTMYYQP